MLQHEFFEESSKEGMISILSVLTERQRIRKSTIRKTPTETPEVRPAVSNIILFC
jgi:hypothetical protein